MVSKKRLDYLDISRGIALLFVIMGHIYSSDNIFITWIYSFHVPLFFIISGVLINYKSDEGDIVNTLIKRIKMIIVPYIFFGIVNTMFEMILSPSTGTLKWTMIQTISLFGIGATWFLPALFISETLFRIIQKYIKNKYLLFMVISIIFFIPFVIDSNHIIITAIFRSFTATGYIYIGYCMSNYIINYNLSWKVTLLFLSISIILANINGNVDLYSLVYNNPILYTITGILGSIVIIETIKKMDKCKFKFFKFIGLNSIVIMATHQNIITMTRLILNTKLDGFIQGTMVVLIIMILEYPIVKLINIYMPWVLGKFNRVKKLSMIMD